MKTIIFQSTKNTNLLQKWTSDKQSKIVQFESTFQGFVLYLPFGVKPKPGHVHLGVKNLFT